MNLRFAAAMMMLSCVLAPDVAAAGEETNALKSTMASFGRLTGGWSCDNPVGSYRFWVADGGRRLNYQFASTTFTAVGFMAYWPPRRWYFRENISDSLAIGGTSRGWHNGSITWTLSDGRHRTIYDVGTYTMYVRNQTKVGGQWELAGAHTCTRN